ncbi:hypothetical protein BDZ97DRAFT_1922244 [Flammula alnicola]|nr:hypothetical protein BDZ97DRAFT_1922244 [Flammula alnicola]
MDTYSEQVEIVIASSTKSSVPSGSLRPIVPQSTGRYDVQIKVQRANTIVEPGMFTSSRDASPTYLPPQWSASVHPEGKLYFYRDAGLRVVTECYLYAPEFAEQICYWAAEVEKQASEQGLALTNDMELFLQLEDEDCNYYLADSATQTVFWLSRDETDELGLLPVVSPSHLKLLLETQYWSHIENFCMHIGGLPQKCIDDLILVFSHGLADNLTSSLSTFPYDATATEKFLNLLTASRDRIHDGHTVAIVARLWGLIMYNRYETHYGQEQSRLSRDTSILVDDIEEIQWTKPVFSFLTLGISEKYCKRLDKLFVDQFVYGSDWDSFMSYCIGGWQKTIIGSAGLLALHIFCFFLPVLPALAYTSATLASLSLLISALLIHRHEELDKSGASSGHEYLDVVCSRYLKFQGVAFAFALPRSLFLWALLAFFLQWATTLLTHVYLPQAAFFTFLIVCVLLSVHFATSPTQLRKPSFSVWKPRFNSEKDEASVV